MLRNDYRRALIMLRGLRPGVSGYVRLERRTLIGTLQFTINGAPQDGALYALLLYRQNGLWYACKLDKLGPPRYGQAGMVYRFDPRGVCGRDLEQYALVAVAALNGEACELLLAGYLNGSVETDWQQVRQAACAALQPPRAAEEPADGAEAAEDAQPVPKIPPAAGEKEETPAPVPQDEGEGESPEETGAAGPLPADTETGAVGPLPADTETGAAGPLPADTETDAAGSLPAVAETGAAGPLPADTETGAAGPLPADTEMRPAPVPDEFDQPARSDRPPLPDAFDTPAQPEIPGKTGVEAGRRAAPPVPPTAGDQLPLDMSAPWPESIESLRPLFRTQTAAQPFEEEGFVLVKAPVAAGLGIDHCVVGVSAEEGRPARVLYGVPAHYTPAPPPGLEGYAWRGDANSGYWVIVRPVE